MFPICEEPLCWWSHVSWIYNYLCNQCLLPLTLWVQILFMAQWISKCSSYLYGLLGNTQTGNTKIYPTFYMFSVSVESHCPGCPMILHSFLCIFVYKLFNMFSLEYIWKMGQVDVKQPTINKSINIYVYVMIWHELYYFVSGLETMCKNFWRVSHILKALCMINVKFDWWRFYLLYQSVI
jgi:hypothetical protein